MMTVLLLEEHYDGPRQFDAHALRTEDDEGVWEFVRNGMRGCLIFKERAAAVRADPEVQEWLSSYRRAEPELDELPRFSKEHATALKERKFDLEALRTRGIGPERIDMLAMEHLLGARG